MFGRLTKGLLNQSICERCWRFLNFSSAQKHFLCQPLSWELSYHHQIRPCALSQRWAYHPVNARDTQTEAVNIQWQWFQFQKWYPWTIFNTENTHSKNHVSCIFDLNSPFWLFSTYAVQFMWSFRHNREGWLLPWLRAAPFWIYELTGSTWSLM